MLLAGPALAAPVALSAPAAATVSSLPRPVPPSLTVAPSWQFQVGAQVDRAAAAASGPYDLSVYHRQVPVALTWQGSARAGIDHYDLYRYSPVGGALSRVLTHTRQTRYETTHNDIHHAFGPVTRSLYATFKVVATDRFGRTAVADQVRRGPVSYEQENGTTYANGNGSAPVFTGKPVAGRGWQTQRGEAYDGGTVLASARQGAQIAIPLKISHSTQVALEMTTGPQLGAVEVRVDGRRVAVVDTWARTTRARVLVAQYRLEAGRHTVTLVNLGIRPRPTVQFDGVFVSD